ncbi:hypothetical protein D3C79_771630 [compost metagenome]
MKSVPSAHLVKNVHHVKNAPHAKSVHRVKNVHHASHAKTAVATVAKSACANCVSHWTLPLPSVRNVSRARNV